MVKLVKFVEYKLVGLQQTTTSYHILSMIISKTLLNKKGFFFCFLVNATGPQPSSKSPASTKHNLS